MIAGDPQRCIDTIHRWADESGLTTISGTFHFGGMPQEMAIRISGCLPTRSCRSSNKKLTTKNPKATKFGEKVDVGAGFIPPFLFLFNDPARTVRV